MLKHYSFIYSLHYKTYILPNWHVHRILQSQQPCRLHWCHGVLPQTIVCIITMTSKWAWWSLKSPALRFFTQPFIQTQIKDNIKAPRHRLCVRNSPGTGELPAQMASYAENVSILWRHRAMLHHTVKFIFISMCIIENRRFNYVREAIYICTIMLNS